MPAKKAATKKAAPRVTAKVTKKAATKVSAKKAPAKVPAKKAAAAAKVTAKVTTKAAAKVTPTKAAAKVTPTKAATKVTPKQAAPAATTGALSGWLQRLNAAIAALQADPEVDVVAEGESTGRRRRHWTRSRRSWAQAGPGDPEPLSAGERARAGVGPEGRVRGR